MGPSPVLRVLWLEPPGVVVRGGRVHGGGDRAPGPTIPLPVLLCSLSSHTDPCNELLCFEFALVKNYLSLLELREFLL